MPGAQLGPGCSFSATELFIIISMNMMNREIIWAGKREFDSVLCNL